MFNIRNFYISSIVEDEHDNTAIDHKLSLRSVSIGDDYEDQVPVDWYKHYYDFLGRQNYIDFKPGDDGEKDDLVVIKKFQLPSYFGSFGTPSDIIDCPPLKSRHIKPRVIKSFIGSVKYNGETLILFQRFRDSAQLPQMLPLSFDSDSQSFKKMDRPILSFGSSIMAVYKHNNRRLIFKRFNDVSYILDLQRYFAHLSPTEIKGFLDESGLFEYNEKELQSIIHKASPLLATRFALVKKSGILDRVDAQQVKNIGDKYKNVKEYKVNINLSDDGNRIVFPSKKSEAHNLLRLLGKKFFTDDFDNLPHLARDTRPLS